MGDRILEPVDRLCRIHACFAHERLYIHAEHDGSRGVHLTNGLAECAGPLLEGLLTLKAGEERCIAKLPRPYRGVGTVAVHYPLDERYLALDEVVIRAGIALPGPGDIVHLGKAVISEKRDDRLQVVRADSSKHLTESILCIMIVLAHLGLEELPGHEHADQREVRLRHGSEVLREIMRIPVVKRRTLIVERIQIDAYREERVADRPRGLRVDWLRHESSPPATYSSYRRQKSR